jgi:hypothetical protein
LPQPARPADPADNQHVTRRAEGQDFLDHPATPHDQFMFDTAG